MLARHLRNTLPMQARHPRKRATHASTNSTPFLELSLIMISMLSLFECITRSSSLSLEETKLLLIAIAIIAIVN